jgi:hypothetical protein
MIASSIPESEVLKTALTECQQRLNRFREMENWLEADLAEADLRTVQPRLRSEDRSAHDGGRALPGTVAVPRHKSDVHL